MCNEPANFSKWILLSRQTGTICKLCYTNVFLVPLGLLKLLIPQKTQKTIFFIYKRLS